MTILIVAVTVLVSLLAFNDVSIYERFVFFPYRMKRDKEWYRAFTSGLIHADWIHLFFNMYVLYSFGRLCELMFISHFRAYGEMAFVVMYLLALVLSETYSYFKHQDDYGYRSLGASGAVSAIIFACILFSPLIPIGIMFLPFEIPGFIMGTLYLVYSQYMAQRGADNIGHNAHFYGALIGFTFPLLLHLFIYHNFSLLFDFIDQIKAYL